MKILSIDHATISNGFCFMKTETDARASGRFILSGKSLIEAKETYNDIIELYKPDLMVLEKVNIAGQKFGGNNVLKLCKFRTMIELVCEEKNIRTEEINPGTMKKFVTGNGRATKLEVAESISSLYNIDLSEIYFKEKSKIICDESDAIALCHFAKYNLCSHK